MQLLFIDLYNAISMRGTLQRTQDSFLLQRAEKSKIQKREKQQREVNGTSLWIHTGKYCLLISKFQKTEMPKQDKLHIKNTFRRH